MKYERSCKSFSPAMVLVNSCGVISRRFDRKPIKSIKKISNNYLLRKLNSHIIISKNQYPV